MGYIDCLHYTGHSRNASRDGLLQMTQGSEGSSSESGDSRNQVVAVGTPLATVVGTQQGPVMVSYIDGAFFFFYSFLIIIIYFCGVKVQYKKQYLFIQDKIEIRILGMMMSQQNRNEHRIDSLIAWILLIYSCFNQSCDNPCPLLNPQIYVLLCRCDITVIMTDFLPP